MSISKEKTGVDTTLKVMNPITNEEVPLWIADYVLCLLYTSPSPRDAHESRMPSSA